MTPKSTRKSNAAASAAKKKPGVASGKTGARGVAGAKKTDCRRPETSADASSEDTRTLQEKKEAALAALAESLGIALLACKRAGIRYEEFLQWRREDPEFARQAAVEDERAVDFVEAKAFEEIKKGNPRLIQFYLQTKGRDRGYGRVGAEKPTKKETSPLNFLSDDEMDY